MLSAAEQPRFFEWRHWRRMALAAALCLSPIPSQAQSAGPPQPPLANPSGEATGIPSSQPKEAEPAGFWDRDTLTGDWFGLRKTLEDRGIKFGLQEQSEVWGNLAGGLRRGATYDGLTTASLKLDLDKLAGLPNTTFFVDVFQIHGRGPSPNLVGALQLVSSIEATPATRLYNLWLETVLLNGRLNLRLGQEAASDELMLTQYGALFLNSSFGFPPLAASDLPSGGPNYPLATPFIRGKYKLGDGFALVAALFNGDPARPGQGDPQLRDANGTAFRLNAHALIITELWYSPDWQGALPATYKLGAWLHTGRFNDQVLDQAGRPLAAGLGPPLQHDHDYALYGVIDQMVWRRPGTDDQGIGLFLEMMGAPADRNLTSLSIAAGLNWKAPLPSRTDDSFGFAVTFANISPLTRQYGQDVAALTPGALPYAAGETAIEGTYLYQAAPWLALQPDAQFVVNPGAKVVGAPVTRAPRNAFITGLRATITF